MLSFLGDGLLNYILHFSPLEVSCLTMLGPPFLLFSSTALFSFPSLNFCLNYLFPQQA